MNNPRILVIGDAMTDHYWFATTTRVSAEAPIPVCAVSHTRSFPGGAKNVAENLRTLGAQARLLHGTIDDSGDCIPTKHRLMVDDYQVARWDMHDHVEPINPEEVDEVVLLFKPDAIIVSDYAKGSINDETISAIADARLPVFIDTRRTPVSFQPIRTRTFFPNRLEYYSHPDYEKEANVILKASEGGIFRLSFGNELESYPALARKVVSVCGAGDTVIAAYVYAKYSGYAGSLLSFANRAAAIVVEKPFTATVTVEEMKEV